MKIMDSFLIAEMLLVVILMYTVACQYICVYHGVILTGKQSPWKNT